jgi:hypothetical protein
MVACAYAERRGCPQTAKFGSMRRILFVCVLLLAAGVATRQPRAERWWKGNLHTHSLWTDGADFPEMIASWYKENGYHFIALTEHDMLQAGERWVDINAPDAGWPPRNASTRAALPAYRARFGSAWVQERIEGARHLVRLRPLNEYRHLFEEANRFMFLIGEEITDKGGAHINAFNLDAAILPRGGSTTAERIRNNLQAVAEQRRITARPILTIVNHPNYVWALKADELAAIPDVRFFEVYNGHWLVNNAGDSIHPSTERMWDMMLTRRHQSGGAPIFGVAVDDAHEYRSYSDTIALPGRGWVMVRASELTPESLIAAMERGDFYASTGITLNRMQRDQRGIRITIAAEPGVTYVTHFIGTRQNSSKVGEVLEEVRGAVAEYQFSRDERYVRALIVSSKSHTDPVSGKQLDREKAWVQPVFN